MPKFVSLWVTYEEVMHQLRILLLKIFEWMGNNILGCFLEVPQLMIAHEAFLFICSSSKSHPKFDNKLPQVIYLIL